MEKNSGYLLPEGPDKANANPKNDAPKNRMINSSANARHF
jgi:hypothetical protein